MLQWLLTNLKLYSSSETGTIQLLHQVLWVDEDGSLP